VGRILSEVDRAYLAGLFDADGAIMASIEKHQGKKYGYRVRVILKLTQKHPTLLRQLKKLTGVGYLTQNRTTYDWVIKNQRSAFKLLDLIQEFSLGKRKQIRLALKILATPVNSGKDLLQVAQLADTLASFNVRSKNRRKNFASKIQESIPRND
jgi:hypothetical protein